MTILYDMADHPVHKLCVQNFTTLMESHFEKIEEEYKKILELYNIDLSTFTNSKVTITNKKTMLPIDVSMVFLGTYNVETEIYEWSNYNINDMMYNFINEHYDIHTMLGGGSFLIPMIFSNKVKISAEIHTILPAFIRMFNEAYRLIKISDDTTITYILIENYTEEEHVDFEDFCNDINRFDDYCNYVFKQYYVEQNYPPFKKLDMNYESEQTLLLL